MRRTKISSGLAILVMTVILAACAPSLPQADGKELYNYIMQRNYTKWKMWPGKSALYPGTEPHGALLTTYVNDKAFKAIQDRQGSLPAGSIIVKENYMPDRQLAAVTVMYKVENYDPANNNWFWLKYAPDGKIDAEGKVQGCIDCHGRQRGNDFIYTSGLK